MFKLGLGTAVPMGLAAASAPPRTEFPYLAAPLADPRARAESVTGSGRSPSFAIGPAGVDIGWDGQGDHWHRVPVVAAADGRQDHPEAAGDRRAQRADGGRPATMIKGTCAV